MIELRYTLVTDGSSDRCLLYVIDWLLAENSTRAFQGQWADLRLVAQPPRSLRERVALALQVYPCEVLFIHRDAEQRPREPVVEEIRQGLPTTVPAPVIPVVPVRMQEAWFLFDEGAIRSAAGNPNGSMVLPLPSRGKIERIVDPKTLLHGLLRDATGLSGRRLRRWSAGVAVHRLAELIDEFSPLRELSAFHALEADIQALLAQQGWR